ncbi:MAG: dTDP-4-dehydrorhamnose reductase [Spirochaetia bacterium]
MYLILGKDGQLGHAFQQSLQAQNIPYCAPEESDADILCLKSLTKQLELVKPSFLINCAAYTDVEKAEDHPDRAYDINSQGPHNIGQVCEKMGIPCVHFSTDYVFGGDRNIPYTEEDLVNPQSVYAKSKQEGEQALLQKGAQCLIFRTSWLYSSYGRNFYTSMRSLGQQRSHLNVVIDQVGTPTYAPFLVEYVCTILPKFEAQYTGIYHLGDEGVASWYDFACQVMESEHLGCAVQPITTDQYPTKAPRPCYSVLSKDKVKKIFSLSPSYWKKGVHACQQHFLKTSL